MSNSSGENQRLIPNRDTEIVLYKRRWIFLFGISLVIASSKFSSVCFGSVNDIFTTYFNVANDQAADRIILSVHTMSCLAVPILA